MNKLKTAALIWRHVEQRVFLVLLVLTVGLALLYIYFLGTAVVNAVERKGIQQNIAQASSQIADLEVDYLERKSGISEDLIGTLGFSSIAQKEYVERTRYLGQASAQ
ncbi:hypothetical protein COB52_02330 [Candidatus Kaiserbacteria bacterium]|nr:MAG: hypothetical protein COB52_02330 [Candidatus Kaiserbacteria bacterium]